jgi:hypothetical protein
VKATDEQKLRVSRRCLGTKDLSGTNKGTIESKSSHFHVPCCVTVLKVRMLKAAILCAVLYCGKFSECSCRLRWHP